MVTNRAEMIKPLVQILNEVGRSRLGYLLIWTFALTRFKIVIRQR
ncbi:MAG: hypothetical protein ACRCZS_13915 [Chroococcidiopsis sp.]